VAFEHTSEANSSQYLAGLFQRCFTQAGFLVSFVSGPARAKASRRRTGWALPRRALQVRVLVSPGAQLTRSASCVAQFATPLQTGSSRPVLAPQAIDVMCRDLRCALGVAARGRRRLRDRDGG